MTASSTETQSRPNSPRQLAGYQRLLLRGLAGLMRLWAGSLHFTWGREVQRMMDAAVPPAVVILWHNRLFAAPELFRRYFRARPLAGLISASGDGAWLAAFVKMLGMHPVRGSRHKRGAQAMRELIAANRQGYDVAVTPDGSRGPMYEMKPGAVSVALKTGAPIVLLSMNFDHAWRLKSWDRFYLPAPFSRVDVRMDIIDGVEALGTLEGQAAAEILKTRLDAITSDIESGERVGRVNVV